MDDTRANVKIVCKDSAVSKIFIDGKEIHGVTSYKIEQNATDKRTPILKLEVKCNIDLETILNIYRTVFVTQNTKQMLKLLLLK